jgi:hypothetical protein
MPDQPVEREGPEPYPHRLEMRVSRLEGDMSDVGASIARLDGRIGRLEATTERLDERLGRLEATTERLDGRIGRLEAGFARLEALFTATLPHLATKEDIAMLPHLATKEEVAKLPTKGYMWGVLAVLITAMYGAFGAGLAAIAMLR